MFVETDHPAEVVYDAGPAGHGCRAECGCGWYSESCGDDDATALGLAAEHAEIAAGDLFDRSMNGLLDLQDDLVQVTIWLADHWTACLPAPVLRGRHPDLDGGRALDVTVPCPDRRTLDAVADLLAVPVVPDSVVAASGTTYVRAARSFGTVAIEAWAVDR